MFSANVRVVRKDSFNPAIHKKEFDQVDYCLECWKVFMSFDNERNKLDAKTMSLMTGDSDGYDGQDDDKLEHAHENRIGDATDASISSLKRINQWAIYKKFGIGQIWSFPNADLLIVYPKAIEELESKLRSNSCTSILF